MGETLGLDKEKPNRVAKVAVKMLKCELGGSFTQLNVFFMPLLLDNSFFFKCHCL